MESTSNNVEKDLSIISETEREKFLKAKQWYTEGEYRQEEMDAYYNTKSLDNIDRKLYTIGKPAAFTSMTDPHPKELLSIPEVTEYMHRQVCVDGDTSGKYRVFWPAFQLEVPDYLASKARSEITFVHVHVLVPEDMFIPSSDGIAGSYKRDVEARKLDNYCVRLPNKKFVKIDADLVKKLYSHMKASKINRDNVLIVGKHVLTYMPQDLYESKLAKEEQSTQTPPTLACNTKCETPKISHTSQSNDPLVAPGLETTVDKQTPEKEPKVTPPTSTSSNNVNAQETAKKKKIDINKKTATTSPMSTPISTSLGPHTKRQKKIK